MTAEDEPEPKSDPRGQGAEGKEHSAQEELVARARKVEDLCVELRSEAYKLEMSIRKCEKCIANNKEAKV